MSSAGSSAGDRFINGRYRVLRSLGEGAMGSVELVADVLEDDRLVALKTVRRAVMNHQSDRLFREEFLAMTQLRHPNVVEVYDFGTISTTGDHFFTMEYVDGKNLLDACAHADVSDVHGYAAQICRALEYIHSQGFVHFDLKPDNIMVDASGVTKVMDFGLVEKGCFFDAQVLKGTVAYIAPEMIRGERVDHRLDLYSLGAVLFHVLGGRMLFNGRSLTDILRGHVHEAPNLTDGLKTPIPPPFDRILPRLLAKKPADRYASAAEVLTELEQPVDRRRSTPARDQGTAAIYKLGSRLVGRAAQLDRLLAVFRRRAWQPEPTGPCAALVMGGSGMGKSRLVEELRHDVQIQGVGFLHGACIQNGGHSYLPFAEILRSLVREILGVPRVSPPTSSTAPPPPLSSDPALSSVPSSPPLPLLDFAQTIDTRAAADVVTVELTPTITSQIGAEVRALSGRPTVTTILTSDTFEPPSSSLGPRVGTGPTGLFMSVADRGGRRLLEANAAALSMLVPAEIELRALAEAEGQASPSGRDKNWVIESICSFLVELSRLQPLVLYCSDLQWADDLTVELFARLARAVVTQADDPPRLMLCGCMRDDEIAGTALEKVVEDLQAERAAEAIRLGPLGVNAIEEMLRSMLGHIEIAPEALRILTERTGGIPFSIEATLQDLLERRAISRRGSAWSLDAFALGSARAPATVAEALDRTLDKVSEIDAAVLRLLAVFNRPATGALLRASGCLTSEALSPVLARLRSRHLVQRGWAEDTHQWSLRHARLRDHVYRAIDPEERKRLHAAAGAALNLLYPGVERYFEDISQHFERAGELDYAIGHLRAAADQAKRVYDLKRAAALYTRAYDALGSLPETEERRILRVDLAVAIAESSYYSPSEISSERLKQALAVVEAMGDGERHARVHNWLGRTHYALGRNKEAIACFQELMRLTEGTADDLTRALPYEVLGRVYVFMGRFEQARHYLGRAASLLRGRPGSEENLSYVLGMYGGAYIYLGDFVRAEQLTIESIAVAESIGHRVRASQGRIYLGIVYAIQGEWRRARAVLEQGLETARGDGNVIGAGTGSSFLGLTYLAEGDAARAVELCRFARDHIAGAGGTWTFSMVGSHLAEALLASGEPERALEVATGTLPIIDAGERWGEVYLHLALGRIHARLGGGAAALESFKRAQEAADRQQSPTYLAKVHLATGAFHLATGDVSAGTALVTRASASFNDLGMPWYAERARALLAGRVDIGPYP